MNKVLLFNIFFYFSLNCTDLSIYQSKPSYQEQLIVFSWFLSFSIYIQSFLNWLLHWETTEGTYVCWLAMPIIMAVIICCKERIFGVNVWFMSTVSVSKKLPTYLQSLGNLPCWIPIWSQACWKFWWVLFLFFFQMKIVVCWKKEGRCIVISSCHDSFISVWDIEETK